MIDRRRAIQLTIGAGAALKLHPLLMAAEAPALLRRAIPSTGEMIPVVGLGSAATFGALARSPDVAPLGEVLREMTERGATVFDTAPIYGTSEEVAGRLARQLVLTNRIFWATKVNVAVDGVADPAAARAQVEDSFRKIGVSKLQLVQVHNLADIPVQFGILKDLKSQGRIRYIGVTTTSKSQYGELERVMRDEPLDFIGVDYAVDNRSAEETILPLALERKVAVMVYIPFGRTRLFQRVAGRELPDWATDFDASSWAQFFIKFVLGHPAVTVVTPATSKASHMVDNIGGGIGRLPDVAARRRMVEFIDALPAV